MGFVWVKFVVVCAGNVAGDVVKATMTKRGEVVSPALEH
jgi:hypothetical protein